MIRLLRFGLPTLGMFALLTGMSGLISMAILVGACAVWLAPSLRSSGTATPPTRHADPLQSSFETVPAPDGTWTRFTIHPARGRGPWTTLPGFIGAAGASLGAVWLVGQKIPYNPSAVQELMLLLTAIAGFLAANWVIHRPYIAGYRSITAAPNAFELGSKGLRVAGTTLDRASLLKLRLTNPITQAQRDARPVASGWVAGGTGALGAAAAAGTAIGSGMAQAAALQGANLRMRAAQHAWVLEVVDTQGHAYRLAGGMTADTADALVHAIEQHLWEEDRS